MPRKEEDSLGQDVTRAGEPQTPKPSDTERSLGDQSTYGDAGSSVSDISGLDDAFESDMEVVDLSARYEIEGTLGKGGMGEVQLATDTRLGRKVAIKRILGEAANSRTAVSRFIAEAKAIAQLDHDNIVDIYDYGRASDGPFLIMQFIDGGSLLDRCREGALPLEEAVELTCQLCGALEMAHDAGIIHRDIKPANVLMTKDGSPRLTDFGLVRDTQADHGQTMAGAVLGTIDFMPPEQRRDASLVDARSDLWSLAATLYQMVTGKSPKIIRFNNVPQALQDVLGKALEDAKDDRYQTAEEFRDALRDSLTASAPAPEVAVDLSAGECPQCHTKNESSRKFCSKCAESLRLNCLSCEGEIPVWDTVCGECGGKQPDLVAARRAALDAQRAEAESLLSQYAFADSLRIAKEIAAVEDSRLQHLKEWSEGFITSTTEEENRQQQFAADHFAEAQTHRASFDYKSAIQAMESIHEAMRTSEMSSYLQQLQSDHAESEELTRTISDRVKRRDLDGLLDQVNRALELRGDRADLPKLKIQLEARLEKLMRHRDEAFRDSKKLFAKGKAKEALARVERIDSTVLRPDDTEHVSRLRHIVEEEAKLYALVAECKKDGVIDPEEVVRMLTSSLMYLELNPENAKVLALRDQLLERIYRTPDQYVSVLAKLPLSILGKLPVQLLSKLPVDSLSKLPVDLLSKLPVDSLSKLPAWVLSKIPPDVILTLPPLNNTIGIQLKLIPAGEFLMGSPETESDRDDNETQHQVMISKPFYLSVHEVTQEQYERVMGENPSDNKGANKPVEEVSWEDARKFCRKLSEHEGEEYRLPTEAEWEYACRGGTTTAYSFGDNESQLGKYAWYGWGPSRLGETHVVGEKLPNAWGLYDMHGNVFEWCQDWFEAYGSENVLIDPTGPASGKHRVMRGGSHLYKPVRVSSANRGSGEPDYRHHLIGFRLARTCPVIASGNKGEYDQAIADYTEAIRIDPDDAADYCNRGNAYANKGEYDQAIADYTLAIRINPEYADAYNGRGFTSGNKGEYDQAIADYTEAIRIDPDNADIYNNRGYAYDNKGEDDQAIADYTEAIRIDPDHLFAYNNRGYAYDNKGEYDQAIADYTEAIRLDPDNAAAYNNRGNAYRNKGEYDQAIADFTEAIRIDPEYVRAYYNRGLAYDNKREDDQAIADYTLAIRFNPEYADAYNGRGFTYDKKGEYDQAIADYTEAIRIDPDNADIYNNRGYAYDNKGEDDQAIADYTEAIRIDPDHLFAYNNRGDAYANKGEYDQAIADFTEAIRIDPDNADIYHNRGLAYGKKGDESKSKADLSKAKELGYEEG